MGEAKKKQERRRTGSSSTTAEAIAKSVRRRTKAKWDPADRSLYLAFKLQEYEEADRRDGLTRGSVVRKKPRAKAQGAPKGELYEIQDLLERTTSRRPQQHKSTGEGTSPQHAGKGGLHNAKARHQSPALSKSSSYARYLQNDQIKGRRSEPAHKDAKETIVESATGSRGVRPMAAPKAKRKLTDTASTSTKENASKKIKLIARQLSRQPYQIKETRSIWNPTSHKYLCGICSNPIESDNYCLNGHQSDYLIPRTKSGARIRELTEEEALAEEQAGPPYRQELYDSEEDECDTPGNYTDDEEEGYQG